MEIPAELSVERDFIRTNLDSVDTSRIIAAFAPDAAAALAKANGKRRTRRLDLNDVAICICDALVSGHSWRAADEVANAYGYASQRTVCVAAERSDGTVRVVIGVGSASKGASPTKAVGAPARDARAKAWLDWANADKPDDKY